MNGDFPSPAVCLLRREARVVMPSLVEELDRTICQTAPRERGDRINHHPKFIFGCLQFIECLLSFPSAYALPGSIDDFLRIGDPRCFTDTIRFRMSHYICFAMRFRGTHGFSPRSPNS